MSLVTHGYGGVPEAQRYAVPVTAGDSLREQIIEQVDARLKSILVANNYKTNAGQNVYAFRGHAIESSKLPALFYKDSITGTTQETIGQERVELTVTVVARSKTAQEVRRILDDIKTAIKASEEWNQLAEFTRFPLDGPEVEQAEDKILTSEISFTITYLEGRHNAYA